MSKRNSLTGSGGTGGNTLFKYFTKSPGPSTPKTPNTSQFNESSPSPSVSKQKSQFSTPTSTKSSKLSDYGNKRSIDELEKKHIKDDDDDEEPINKTKKRSRLLIVDSDSDQENSNDTNLSRNDTTTSTKKHQISSDTDECSSTTTKKLKRDNIMPESMSFQDKLKFISSSTSTNNLSDLEVAENMIDDEPVVWLHNRLDFLKIQNLKDKYGRRPLDPEYDGTTLHVPKSYLENLSPGVRQWWDLKIDNFDCILFFKVGKFYELYHMDADVGVNELGFTYMKGDFAHSGFPEQSYDRMATSLVARGYKVARIEQTETPDMMQERVKKMKKFTKFDRVVKREVCQITNRGTEVFGQQVAVTNNHQANYMLAIAEKKQKGRTSRYGICFIDTSLGEFHIGEFDDDKQCSRLLTLLSHYPPALVLSERNSTRPHTQLIFKTVLSNTLKEQLTNETQFWSAAKTLKVLAEKYYQSPVSNKTEWPSFIKSLQDQNDHLGLTVADHYELAIRALGATVWYMTKCLIDEQIMAMAEYVFYSPPDNYISQAKMDDAAKAIQTAGYQNRNMVLDSITLSNLKVCNSEYSLLNAIDHCCTKFGKRLLNYWVCTPSCSRDTIIDRQDAIQELMKNNPLMQDIRTLLATLPDLERLLVQIHSFGNAKRKTNHPDGRAVMFEQKIYNKKKIQDFISTLRGFEAMLRIPKMFSKCSSTLLHQLTQQKPKGKFPKMEETLKFFQTGFDHDVALRDGVIAPEKGVDHDFDEAVNEIKSIEHELAVYLKTQEKYFNCRITYFGNDKKRFQLEIPESNAKRADASYYLEGQRKGAKPVKRFHTDETRDLLKRMLQAEDERNAALNDLSRKMFEKFSAEYEIWKLATQLTATLDVIASLAIYANNQTQLCFPEILSNENGPILELDDGYHPCMRLTDDFIPNGIKLGGNNDDRVAPLVLLTGPNMGGKSTLMRQIGLLIIMAQMGCPIPATSCRFSIVDRIFTRLGAQDDIMAGHSTFLVELNETSAILKHATVNSLVLLDELGRGTATYDGTSIAASVVNFLAKVKCRTLFSTHYHNLVDYFHDDKRIAFGHMACMVENEDEDDPTQETVTFLYKYSNGPCPKSYGFNAAKLAGMPMSIIRRAHELSKKVEATAVKHKIFSKMIAADKCEVVETKDLLNKLKSCTIK